MCLSEYLEHYTTKVPVYRRLSKAAAEKRWQRDFNVLEREQRVSVDEEGNDAGMANQQH